MKLLLFLLSSFMMASCTVSTQREDKKAEENKNLIKNLFTAFNRHDWKAMSEMYAEDFESLDPSSGKKRLQQQRKYIVETYSGLQQYSPDIRDSVINLFAEENRVVAEFISTGTTAKGEKWMQPICTVFKIENGLIVSDATYYDRKSDYVFLTAGPSYRQIVP